MFERRMLVFLSAVVTLLGLAVLWDAFVRPAPRSPPSARSGAPTNPPPASTRDNTLGTTRGANASPAAQPPPSGAREPSYLDLLARAEIRRRIRASAGLTYLNEIVAETSDSVLHRWDDRVRTPVRVFLPPGVVANFQAPFLDAVRNAFSRWEEAGVPVRFNVDPDSASAEVRFQWRTQFEGERTGQTDVVWDQDGRMISGVVTLATFDPSGQPLGTEEIRVLALHEIGHVIGLDHCSDSSNLMFPRFNVRDLSPRDIATALLLYQLPPGPVRAGR